MAPLCRCCWHITNKWFAFQVWLVSIFTNKPLDIMKYRPVYTGINDDTEYIMEDILENNRKLQEHVGRLSSDFHDEQRRNTLLQKKLDAMEAEKDEALRRLSEFMSRNLRDNNPNIVDLSDQFRPTKLGEMSNELYDNQWTTAFSFLESVVKPVDERNDRQIIRLLLDVLMESFMFCKETYQNESRWLVESVFGPESRRLTSAEATPLKDLKKQFSLGRLQGIKKSILEYLKTQCLCDPSYYENESLISYVQECARVGWFMQMQDPPVVYECTGWFRKFREVPEGMAMGTPSSRELSTKSGQALLGAGPVVGATSGASPGNDTQFTVESETKKSTSKFTFDRWLYREYTQKGPYIDFVVWPVMYLHENGPLLSKGVAQGC